MGPEQRVNILLVDDQLPNLIALEAILRDLGENLVRAQSGLDALRFLLEAEAAVILMDVTMPQLDGLETARLIRERDWTRHTPIIFLTAYDRTDTELFHGYSLGAVDFLFKPVVPAILRAKVATFVELHRRIRRVQYQEGLLRKKQQEEHERALADEKQRWELERLHERSRQQEVIVEIGQEALGGMELGELFGRAAGLVAPALAVECCVILEPAPDGSALRKRAGVGQANADLEARGQELLAPGATARTSSREGSVLAVLRGPHRPFGVLAIAAPGRAFTHTEVQFLEAVANVLAAAAQRKYDEAALREASRRKDEFLAVLGHELRNPLAPIRNALHILRRREVPAETREKAQAMAERQTRHMARLVDDLLDLSRITRGKIKLQKEAVDLAALAGRVVEAMGPLVREHRHDLQAEYPPGPLVLEADPVRLEQILTNLLSNAVKYTDPGGRISLWVGEEDGEAVLRVRDTGIGIAPDVLPRIFDLFMQAERYLDRSLGGLGIGLTLVRSLVQLHGGSITASSAGLGQGSEFVVRLPLTPVTARAEAPPGPPPPGPRVRILVVDDNADAAISLAVLLRMHGHDVQVVHDGRAALQTAEIFDPEVVLLDIGLPEMDGYEVARRLRQLDKTKDALIVAVSGYTPVQKPASGKNHINHHLIKPLDLDVLLRLLAEEIGPGSEG
jgi:signal transduction histidine kinase/response regulator RpfG family c-di-GMP phosphodiesterase